jgi:hypothetical protein
MLCGVPEQKSQGLESDGDQQQERVEAEEEP